jgi:propionyl-CoA carboxylase alpha chain
MVKIGEAELALEVEGAAPGPYRVTFPQSGRKLELNSPWKPGDPLWAGSIGDRTVALQVRPILNGLKLAYRGIQVPVYVYTEREAALAALMPEKAAADTSKFLLCPMPGLVKAIHVTEGQEVQAGDALAVVEAMKMENILRAERNGSVKKVNAKPGDSLAVDAVILEFA